MAISKEQFAEAFMKTHPSHISERLYKTFVSLISIEFLPPALHTIHFSYVLHALRETQHSNKNGGTDQDSAAGLGETQHLSELVMPISRDTFGFCRVMSNVYHKMLKKIINPKCQTHCFLGLSLLPYF